VIAAIGRVMHSVRSPALRAVGPVSYHRLEGEDGECGLGRRIWRRTVEGRVKRDMVLGSVLGLVMGGLVLSWKVLILDDINRCVVSSNSANLGHGFIAVHHGVSETEDWTWLLSDTMGQSLYDQHCLARW
jgi:hypothetical protein